MADPFSIDPSPEAEIRRQRARAEEAEAALAEARGDSVRQWRALGNLLPDSVPDLGDGLQARLGRVVARLAERDERIAELEAERGVSGWALSGLSEQIQEQDQRIAQLEGKLAAVAEERRSEWIRAEKAESTLAERDERIAALEGLLREVEFGNYDSEWDVRSCPICDGEQRRSQANRGHEADCRLLAALSPTEEAPDA